MNTLWMMSHMFEYTIPLLYFYYLLYCTRENSHVTLVLSLCLNLLIIPLYCTLCHNVSYFLCQSFFVNTVCLLVFLKCLLNRLLEQVLFINRRVSDFLTFSQKIQLLLLHSYFFYNVQTPDPYWILPSLLPILFLIL